MFRRKIGSVGLALGAGGARGLAHVGVLKALDEMNIKVEAIAGTSMGAIIGAMFAFFTDYELISEKLRSYFEQNKQLAKEFKILNKASSRNGRRFSIMNETVIKIYLCSHLALRTNILKGDILSDFINTLIPDADISDSTIPLAVVSFDLTTGSRVIFTQGSVRRAVLASSSIPGIFPPVEHDGMLLVDGGAISPVPVDAVKALGAKKVLAVDVSPPPSKSPKIDDGIDIMLRVISGQTKTLMQNELAKASFIVTPRIVGIDWWRFEYYREIENRGYHTAKRVLPKMLGVRRFIDDSSKIRTRSR